MKHSLKKIIAVLSILAPVNLWAQTVNTFNGAGSYVPLAPISGFIESGSTDISSYLNNLFRLGVAIASGLAVIMIVLGGIEYLSTDAVSGKEQGREKITAALWGLLIALVSYAFLNTINPQLLNTNLSIQPVVVQAAHLDLPPPTTPIAPITSGAISQYGLTPGATAAANGSPEAINQLVAGAQAAGVTNPAAIAALLSQAKYESDFNPTLSGDNNTSWGMYQVGTNLYNQYTSWASQNGYEINQETQTSYIISRFQQAQPTLYNQFINASTPEQALAIWRSPQWNYGGVNTTNRNITANQFYQNYQNSGTWGGGG